MSSSSYSSWKDQSSRQNTLSKNIVNLKRADIEKSSINDLEVNNCKIIDLSVNHHNVETMYSTKSYLNETEITKLKLISNIDSIIPNLSDKWLSIDNSNNLVATDISNGPLNAFYGGNSLKNNRNVKGCSSFGYNSMKNISSSTIIDFANTAVGYNSMYGISGEFNSKKNTALGYESLYNIKNGGDNNTSIGYRSLYSNTNGNHNVSVGYESMHDNTEGSFNTSTGVVNMSNNTTGNYNSSYGYNSLTSNLSGSYNCSFGTGSLNQNTTGSNNTSYGYGSLYNNTDGSNNTIIGALNDISGNVVVSNNQIVGYNNKTMHDNVNIFGSNMVSNGSERTFINNIREIDVSGSGELQSTDKYYFLGNITGNHEITKNTNLFMDNCSNLINSYGDVETNGFFVGKGMDLIPQSGFEGDVLFVESDTNKPYLFFNTNASLGAKHHNDINSKWYIDGNTGNIISTGNINTYGNIETSNGTFVGKRMELKPEENFIGNVLFVESGITTAADKPYLFFNTLGWLGAHNGNNSTWLIDGKNGNINSSGTAAISNLYTPKIQIYYQNDPGYYCEISNHAQYLDIKSYQHQSGGVRIWAGNAINTGSPNNYGLTMQVGGSVDRFIVFRGGDYNTNQYLYYNNDGRFGTIHGVQYWYFDEAGNLNANNIISRGRIGIGTLSPEYVLDVRGYDYQTLPYDFTYFTVNSIDLFSKGANTSQFNVSMKVEKGIVAEAFIAISDKRIKENIIDIEDTNALNKLRLLQPKTYDYVDKVTRGNTNVIGFIAQEVKEVLPRAVSLIKDYVPNFMTRCKISLTYVSNVAIVESEKDLLWNSLHDSSGNPYIDMSGNVSSDASGNKHFKIKLYDPSNNVLEMNTLNIIDKTHFLINLSGSKLVDTSGNFIGNSGSYLDENGNTIEYVNEYFLYGQQVDDFHSLDKNAIFTVATAALQEVDRQQQADKLRILSLENEVSLLKQENINMKTEQSSMKTEQSSMKIELDLLKQQVAALIAAASS